MTDYQPDLSVYARTRNYFEEVLKRKMTRQEKIVLGAIIAGDFEDENSTAYLDYLAGSAKKNPPEGGR